MCDLFCGTVGLDGQKMCTTRAVQYKQKRCFSGNSGRNEGVVDSLDIIGKGTRLMKSLRLPTVLVRVPNRELFKSRVYYVLLETESEDFPRKIIPAIMQSDASSRWRTQFAELLPLSAEADINGQTSVTPLLYKRRYKSLFVEGCSFKILALESGRFVEADESLPWNEWKLNLTAMRNMITEILYRDIEKMPASMIKRATQCRTRNYSSTSSSASVVLYENSPDSHKESSKPVLSAQYPTLRLPGVTASGGSSFAKWFSVLPPNTRVDENFSCDRGTTLKKDRFVDMETYYRYLRIIDSV